MEVSMMLLLLALVTISLWKNSLCCDDCSPFCRIEDTRLLAVSESHAGLARTDCARTCYEKYGCQAFSYTAGSMSCQLHDQDIDRQSVVADGGWSLFSRRACIKGLESKFACRNYQGCVHPIDINILLESTTTMGESNLNFTIDFIQTMSPLFNFSSGYTRMGAITVGSNVNVVSKIGQFVTSDRFTEAVQSIPRVTSAGNLKSSHIALLRNQTHGEGDRIRDGITKVNMIFLAGDALSGSTAGEFQTEFEKSLADEKIDFLFIALNPSAATSALMTTATDVKPAGHVLVKDNFATLGYQVGEVADLICQMAEARTKYNEKLLEQRHLLEI